MRPIDADALKKEHIVGFSIAGGLFAEVIDAAQTIDVVAVVRCKDCVHLGIKDFAFGYCKTNMCGIVKPDDFCSHGEMQEGE